ncbi:TetR/AcrR family transcriptional regulator [Paremcibacter congregatus]|uniref:HTH tetR-type domain-containing protein n=1 Tax=Paremcibacter congregatus TaxID=2043170 RepID=A0A2G4YQ35_9PROT|nr:TetR family transcriptional regulator [Paremcibacter congregatus]PHZ84432.1 hypothetical protein CRD36_11505 [Paremcibacter congregatus]QDE28650.1 TetR/AcrR family transcriptional regulator [Paremcibacter congregatus]|tara:strand:- start:8027 stop:8767 length:741 start_codon:yes stop_codon:yes gene_type:complete
MKVSKAQKEKNRQKLILAAVALFSEKGYDQVTMKQIATQAKMADSTVYKYFANKEKFLTAYHEMVLLHSLEQARDEKQTAGFDFQEKLQYFLDIYLENLLENREFVGKSLKMMLSSPLTTLNHSFPARAALKDMVTDALTQAVAEEGFPEIPYQNAITHLMTDALFGIVLYWLKDDSEEFSDTTRMIDMALSLLTALLKSGVITKASDLATFVIKSQMMRFLDQENLFTNLMKMTSYRQKKEATAP